ncbi:nitrite reductase [Sclerotinia borealis F-4128]|uniref:Nitrite reductase [NAD(P)H] n=1 Tax=Sclerotinia borealis (strain F-4128) TaxID=1432307 RepID=W9CTU3_SCLBF|nr:nitrite reductase [Sclerotinia borealis F-4128]
MSNWQPQVPIQEVGGPIDGGPDGVKGSGNENHRPQRKRVVVVGLGMYADVPVGSLSYHINTKVVEICHSNKRITCASGETVPYDILILATESDALLPQQTPGHDAKGVFVYRNIEDLENLIRFSEKKKGTHGLVMGGGLLGLEAAKAMMDLEKYKKVHLIERNKWVLSRQLDADAGGLVVEQVESLGLDVMLSKRVGKIEVTNENEVKGVVFEDGEEMECSTICFAIGIKARDELARQAGIKCADRGGGIMVGDDLSTSVKDIYAIGECASWKDQTFGLIAPGIEMADVLSFNLTQAKRHAYRSFKRPDLSTKLKLLGVEVASFGDFFADRDGPKDLPIRMARKNNDSSDASKKLMNGSALSPVKALTYKDPFQAVYKKYLFTMDGKYLLGGMMIGDTRDYVKLVSMLKNQKMLDVPPSQFILGASKEGDDGGDDLDDDTQICSCHNVSKGNVVHSVKEGTCKSIGDVKSCTKAGTGCGGCMPLVTSIFNSTMQSMGQEVKNHMCPHFNYSRADLYNIISVKNLKTLAEVMKEAGNDPDSQGCEACKPSIGSIFSSLYNKHVISRPLHGLQETNDRFLGNIQRNGTFSVVPRVSAGEITPDKLIIIGNVAKKYNLYTKITGGQRIDMFGAKKQDLLAIWKTLVEGGMESGHAYAKSLRTVKSCVGTAWCRYGIADSVGMAVRLEERYKSIRSPHKIKGGVSGCVRECAEAQNKDFGLIATEKGFNIFVGGNGGASPRHSDLLVKDVPPDSVIPILDRYLIFYIRTADKLQRTARWLEALPGGIKYLREVILDDKLGICASLEAQMEELVGSFFDEWAAAITDPEMAKNFKQFDNCEDTVENMELEEDRGQTRPVYWAKESVKTDFKNIKWTSLTWERAIQRDHFKGADEIPNGMSASVKRGGTQLAVWRVRGKWLASQQMCPHKRAFVLSDGFIGDSGKDVDGGKEDKLWVSCPNHKRNFELNGETKGRCQNDEEVSIAIFEAEERDDGWVYLKLPPIHELDGVLGTERWKVRKGESGEGPFEKLDRRIGVNGVGMNGRKPFEARRELRVGEGEGSIDW